MSTEALVRMFILFHGSTSNTDAFNVEAIAAELLKRANGQPPAGLGRDVIGQIVESHKRGVPA
jgi:hypothetical protein